MLKRTLVVLFLLVSLAAPVIAAARSPILPAGPREERGRIFLPDFGKLWEMVTSVVLKAQGSMDPNGKPPAAPPPSGPTSDAQGSMDPNG